MPDSQRHACQRFFANASVWQRFYYVLVCVRTEAADNLVTNPGFESGTTGWYGSGCNFTTSTTVFHSGSRSGYAYNRTNTWNSIRQSMLGKMEAGRTYYISGWMKLEGGFKRQYQFDGCKNRRQRHKLYVGGVDNGI